MPTICMAKDGKTVDFIAGFDDLGGREDFETGVLEWRIARAGVIDYSGDLLQPPQLSKQKKKTHKTIRSTSDDSDDDF